MKVRDIFLTIFFCCFLGITAVMLVMLPKNDVSVYEKRTLAKLPKLSVEAVVDGSFEKNSESYVTDHFPLRDMLVSFNSYASAAIGQNGMDGMKNVYKGKEGYLINAPVQDENRNLKRNMEALNDFADNTQLPALMMIVPTTGAVMEDKLPDNHLTYNDSKIIAEAEDMGKAIEFIDIEGAFESAKNETQLYYKTDHHWTTAGAYTAYTEYCKRLGIEPMWDFRVRHYTGFFGTSYSKSALWNEDGDILEVWDYPCDVSVEIDGEYAGDSMFFTEHLDEVDKYPVFLDGNHGIERIVNHEAEDKGKLLVIKDSFAHSLVPFLAAHYSEIVMIDPRYYFDSVSELAETEGFERVLYVAGLASLCENNDFSLIE